MRKNIVPIVGGLGNQLYCYAFGVALERRTGVKTIYDLSFLKSDRLYGRKYSLSHIGISIDECNSFLYHLFDGALWRWLLRTKKFPLAFERVEEESFEWSMIENNAGPQYYFSGYWQKNRYLDDAPDYVGAEICFDSIPCELDTMLVDNIRLGSSVAVHLRTYCEAVGIETRRGSFSPGVEYYLNSMDYMLKLNPDCKFFIFTDRPDAVDSKFRQYDVVIVSDHISSQYSDFYYMTECKYHIISNSTFSWWAAVLSKSEKILYPERKNLIYYPEPRSLWHIMTW